LEEHQTAYNNQNSPSTFYTATETGINVEAPTLEITATLNAPTLTFEDALAVNAPTLSITTTVFAPTLTYIDPIEMNAPTLDFNVSFNVPRIKVGLWSNTDKNPTSFTNNTKTSTSWTNEDKSI